MYFYKLGYWTYDGQAAVELAHERHFTQAEFRRLVYEAVAALLREERPRTAHFPFAWIYDSVAERLVSQAGFRRVVYAADFEIYGSGSILEGDPLLPDLDALTAYLRDQGLV